MRFSFTKYLAEQSDAPAQWGMMDVHNMVEHLGLTLQMSMGERKTELINSEEKAAKIKRIMIESSRPMPKGIKTSMLPKYQTLPYIHSTYNEAVLKLDDYLDRFKILLKNDASLEYLHPTMGLLNLREWDKLHRKHFTHHFEQFGLDTEFVNNTFG